MVGKLFTSITNVLCEVLAEFYEVIFRYKPNLSSCVSSLIPVRIRGRPINHLQPFPFTKAQFCVILRLERVQGNLHLKRNCVYNVEGCSKRRPLTIMTCFNCVLLLHTIISRMFSAMQYVCASSSSSCV